MDLIKENERSYFFYQLYTSKRPKKGEHEIYWIIYYLRRLLGQGYLTIINAQTLIIPQITKFYPFSKLLSGHLYHNDFKIERQIIERFETLGHTDNIYMSIKGFDSDKVFAYYVGFFEFAVDLEDEIKKLQKTMQSVNPNFYVREYENGWFKIMIAWPDYLELRAGYEKKK